MDMVILSASGANMLQSCERKFVHNYILKTPKDPDWVTPGYFKFGRAFHEVLDVFNHDYRKFDKQTFLDICKKKHLLPTDDAAKLAACLRSYFGTFPPTRFEIVGKEVKFKSKLLMGVIDLVLREPEGERWWLADTKTTGIKFEPREIAKAKLLNDPQIGIYTAFASEIAGYCGVVPEHFQGFLYRQVEKPRIRMKPNELFDDFNRRCGEPPAREIRLDKDEIKHYEAYDNFLKLSERVWALQARIEEEKSIDCSTQNMKNCVEYGTPCQYFSRCYGKTYAQSKAVSNDVLDFL